MYHLTFKDLGPYCFLIPAKPLHFDPNEDFTTPRVSFSPEIKNALYGLTGLDINESSDYLRNQSIIHYNCLFNKLSETTKENAFTDHATFPFSESAKKRKLPADFIHEQQQQFLTVFELYRKHIFNETYFSDRNRILTKQNNHTYLNLSVYETLPNTITQLPNIIPFDHELTLETWSLEPVQVKHAGYLSIRHFIHCKEILLTTDIFS